jgi:serine/threonine protein kinase
MLQVHAAQWREVDVAVKVFKLPAAEEAAAFTQQLESKIQAEAGLLASLRHPHIVTFMGICKAPPCIITELCSNGSLLDVVKRARASPALAAELTWPRRLRMALDAATGMLYLHALSPPLIHRDLKSPNLLVDVHWRVKIADLGMSKVLEEATAATGSCNTAGAPDNPRWLAPEVLEGRRPTAASDVFSFAVVLWEMLTWELPWAGVTNTFAVSALGSTAWKQGRTAASVMTPQNERTGKSHLCCRSLGPSCGESGWRCPPPTRSPARSPPPALGASATCSSCGGAGSRIPPSGLHSPRWWRSSRRFWRCRRPPRRRLRQPWRRRRLLPRPAA